MNEYPMVVVQAGCDATGCWNKSCGADLAELVHNRHMDYLDGWCGLVIVFLLIGHFYPIPGISFGALGGKSVLRSLRLADVRAVVCQVSSHSAFLSTPNLAHLPGFFVLPVAIVVIFLILKKEINWSEVVMAATYIFQYQMLL